MRKLKVYLDTSVVSYLYQLDTPEKMKDTLELWELFRQGRYEVYISDIVLNEISGCSQEKLDILLGYLKQVQYHLVHTDEDTVELAEKFIDFIHQPEIYKMILDEYPSVCLNDAAMEILEADYLDNPGSNVDRSEIERATLIEEVGDAVAWYDEVFTKMKTN